jgi:hypothetical protein
VRAHAIPKANPQVDVRGSVRLAIAARLTAVAATVAVLVAAAPEAHAAGAKYYFQVQEVKAGPDVDAALKTFAGQALKDELSKRPEWASDVGPAGESGRPGQDRAALVNELKKRGLRGFDVTVRIEDFKQEMKEPRPGGKLKQLAVDVRLTVFGTTIPDAKLSFSGTGQSGLEAEVSEKSFARDAADAGRDALKDSIRQAVDQAVIKLAVGKSQPMNEARRRKK